VLRIEKKALKMVLVCYIVNMISVCVHGLLVVEPPPPSLVPSEILHLSPGGGGGRGGYMGILREKTLPVRERCETVARWG
jgi:hypothetical protein